MSLIKITKRTFFVLCILALSPMNKGLNAYPLFFTAIDSLVTHDSTAVLDSLLTDTLSAIQEDTLTPIYASGDLRAENHGIIFTKETLQKNDYRYSGDLFKYTPAGFVYDLGSHGQPNEISIYGKGFQNISYLTDGISINNRITNSFNLYNIQSEVIDSVEIMPLPKGFLYGTTNNPVAAAVYTIDTISYLPLSRIRFYQAAENESYFDASFSAYIMKRVNLSFDMTNSKVSSRFDNSNFGGWRASAKLRYMISNNVNFIVGYNYINTESELNGGSAAAGKNAVSYDNLLENVVYPTASVSGLIFSSRYLKSKSQNIYIKMLGRFIDGVQSELSLYRLNNRIEFRQNERTEIENMPVIIHNNNFTATGLSYKQDIKFSAFETKIFSNYESVKFDSDALRENKSINSFSLAAIISANLFSGRLTPSIFSKYLNYNGSNFTGIGADINFHITNNSNLYAGYSQFAREQEMIYSSINSSKPVEQEIKAFELGLKYNSPSLYGSIFFFSTKNNNELFYTVDRSNSDAVTNEATGYFVKPSETSGLNLNLNFRLWKLLISSKSSYYFNHEKENLTVPEFSSFSGIYYVDTLFNSNLKLKTGINFYINGSQNYFSYDFERSIKFQYANTGSSTILISNEKSDVSYQLDLFAAGQFQDAAIVYITYENILGFDYYIVPYFPKQPRMLRFGISWEFLN